jgi:glycosyltransferase involved in cell wall biosynthesis
MPPALFPRSIQVARLLKGLQRIGWHSTVVTLANSSRLDADPVDHSLAKLYDGYYERAEVPTRETAGAPWAPWLTMRTGRLAPLDQQWAVDAGRAARHAVFRDRAEVLVTFAQPWRDHFVGLSMVVPRLPWVAHFSDPWVDSLYYSDAPQAERDADLRREAAVMRHADLVVFTNHYAADLVMRKYPAAIREKARVVEHATDVDVQTLLTPSPDGHSRRRPLRLSYVGSLLVGQRTADDLLQALAALHAGTRLDDRVELSIVGSGSGTDEAKQRVTELQLESIVRFRPHVPYLESLEVMREADVLVQIDAPAETNVFLASKLADYLTAGRPILAITPSTGPSADLMRNCGYPLAVPGDVSALTRELQRLLDRHESGAAPPTAPAHVLKRYSLDTVARAFANVLDEAVGRSGSRRSR